MYIFSYSKNISLCSLFNFFFALSMLLLVKQVKKLNKLKKKNNNMKL